MGWQLKIEFVMFLHGIVIVMVTKIIFFFYFLQILVKIFSRLLKTSDSDYDGIFLYLPRVTDDICLLTDDTIWCFLTNDDTKKSRWSHSWLLAMRSHAFPTYFVPESENHRDDQRVDDIFRFFLWFQFSNLVWKWKLCLPRDHCVQALTIHSLDTWWIVMINVFNPSIFYFTVIWDQINRIKIFINPPWLLTNFKFNPTLTFQ